MLVSVVISVVVVVISIIVHESNIVCCQMEFAVRMSCQSCVDAIRKALSELNGTYLYHITIGLNLIATGL